MLRLPTPSRIDSTSTGEMIWAFKASASPLITTQVQVQVQVKDIRARVMVETIYD